MLDVAHFLNIYKIRKRMYEDGVTNPIPEAKSFISKMVESLSLRDPKEEVKLLKNDNGISELRTKNNQLIISFPEFENLAKEKTETRP